MTTKPRKSSSPMASRKRPAARGSSGGRKLMAALEDILAAERGESGRVTVRAIEIVEPGMFTPASVRGLRAKMGVTQRIFAQMVGVSAELIEHWEQGVTEPRPIARRLLDRIAEDPSAYLKAVVREQRLPADSRLGARERQKPG